MNSESVEVQKTLYDVIQITYAELIPRGLREATISNADETGLFVVLKSGKVVTNRGAKRVTARTGGERGVSLAWEQSMPLEQFFFLQPLYLKRKH